ncbi:MAG: sigma-70 family RNA polymerase sigma factor [Firmicutes bacterium]|nr:sigma-70 family RNA polymerase sigma factor [Bacillota bacterium]
MTDEELYEGVLRGDGQALSLLYDRYASKVFAIGRRLTSDRQLLEEIVQDVFTRVWTTQGYKPALGAFDHWLSVVARRIAIDHLRKHLRSHKSGVPLDITLLDLPASEGVEKEVQGRLVRGELRTAMSSLRPEERLVLELAYFHGYTLSEVATVLDLPLGTVKTRLHAGLLRLRTRMTDWKLEVLG